RRHADLARSEQRDRSLRVQVLTGGGPARARREAPSRRRRIRDRPDRRAAARCGAHRDPGDDHRCSRHPPGHSSGIMTRWAVFALARACAGAGGHNAYVPPAAPPPPQDVVALLPDPETQKVGSATVSSPAGGSVELTSERAATRVVIGQPPSAAFTFSEAEI